MCKIILLHNEQLWLKVLFVSASYTVLLRWAMASDLKELVKECLGPLPRGFQDQITLDLERARMTAEDARAVAEQWYWAKARMANNVEVSRYLIEEARHTAITAADSGGTRENFRVALIDVNNTLVDAWRATNGTDSEMESESDQESDNRQDETNDSSAEDERLVCANCRTSHFPAGGFTMNPSGMWANRPQNERMFCTSCLDLGRVPGSVESFW